MTKKLKTLDECILLLQEEASKRQMTFDDILHTLSGRGKLLTLIFLSLFFCQPFHFPGMSIPFGLAVAFIGIKMTLGKDMWLPKKLLSKFVTEKTILKITNKVLWLKRKIQPLIHPRLGKLSNYSGAMRTTNGLIIFILGILLALPFPIPFYHFTAAWAIFLIAFGILESDGLLVLIGYFLLLITIGLGVATALSLKHIF